MIIWGASNQIWLITVISRFWWPCKHLWVKVRGGQSRGLSCSTEEQQCVFVIQLSRFSSETGSDVCVQQQWHHFAIQSALRPPSSLGQVKFLFWCLVLTTTTSAFGLKGTPASLTNWMHAFLFPNAIQAYYDHRWIKNNVLFSLISIEITIPAAVGAMRPQDSAVNH